MKNFEKNVIWKFFSKKKLIQIYETYRKCSFLTNIFLLALKCKYSIIKLFRSVILELKLPILVFLPKNIIYFFVYFWKLYFLWLLVANLWPDIVYFWKLLQFAVKCRRNLVRLRGVQYLLSYLETKYTRYRGRISTARETYEPWVGWP